MQHPTQPQSGGGGGNHKHGFPWGMNNTTNSKVGTFVVLLVALTVGFVTVGAYVDTLIEQYNKHNNADNDTQTHLTLLIVQLAVNVGMLLLPYVVLSTCASDSYACQYYLVVGAFWVMSLHAQAHLKKRFYALVGSGKTPADSASHDDDASEESDHVLIAQHVKEAESAHTLTTSKHELRPMENENLQYRANPTTYNAPQMRSNHERALSPLHFDSQDLLPLQSRHTQGTNTADLL